MISIKMMISNVDRHGNAQTCVIRNVRQGMLEMDSFDLKLCDIQGRLFERSIIAELNSVDFITLFMKSEVAKHLDFPYSHM